MLYLYLSDGSIRELPDATRAWIDQENQELVCCTEEGREVARFPRLDVTLYSHQRLPEISPDSNAV